MHGCPRVWRQGPRGHRMRGMNRWLALSLTALLWPIAVAAADTVTVHRCVDGKGRVTLQDDPCPAGSKGTSREMLRPQDAPAKPKAAATEPVIAPPDTIDDEAFYPPAYAPIPPPPMYRCTSYDGKVRESGTMQPTVQTPGALLPAGPADRRARSCRWVEDSCVRLSSQAACTVWKKRKQEAKSKAMHAFSNTAAYWKSELERTTQVVDESCQWILAGAVLGSWQPLRPDALPAKGVGPEGPPTKRSPARPWQAARRPGGEKRIPALVVRRHQVPRLGEEQPALDACAEQRRQSAATQNQGVGRDAAEQRTAAGPAARAQTANNSDSMSAVARNACAPARSPVSRIR